MAISVEETIFEKIDGLSGQILLKVSGSADEGKKSGRDSGSCEAWIVSSIVQRGTNCRTSDKEI